MNKLDKQYTDLLQDILDNGAKKQDRTGTGTISVFGRQIRHKMSEGFPLLTTKKMPFKTIVTELLWFLRGDTNIKYLVDNNCHIWDGDAYKRYSITMGMTGQVESLTQEEFINKIKTDDEFANKWGELGPIYGKQWRNLGGHLSKDIERLPNGQDRRIYKKGVDQIQNLINDLKTNPDSRRLMVNAWNVGELDSMTLPPCHYGFQVYTRELSEQEREDLYWKRYGYDSVNMEGNDLTGIPTRAISLMWNQRSVDTFLGLPFNIASYGLLLEIIAKEVNMVADELIGNLGDVHLYSNHLDAAKEQIGKEFTEEEIIEHLQQSGMDALKNEPRIEYISKLPKRTREPFPLPKINFNSEWWDKPFFELVMNDNFCKCLLEEDIQLYDYQSHPTIKAPLSN
jgi:thymidylate synthase